MRFHGIAPTLAAAQAEALGLEAVVRPTPWDAMGETWDRLLAELSEEGFAGVVFGNLHLEGVRAWYEGKVKAAGLQHLEPIWGESPESIVREAVERGFRARVVCVDLNTANPEWLGRDLDHALVDAFLAAGIDPCGEHGEYHTFVYDGPGFSAPVPFREGEVQTDASFRTIPLDPVPDDDDEDDR